ncbi:MAG: RNA methyltransferase [Thermodesulfobacteriota bacterium]|nr:RNA methyltransferase [Thermodesulfobacteriota bacterium]
MYNLYIALIHYPVANKKGQTIASALTTIDLHDIARAAATFGAAGFYVVTPLEDQQILAQEVMAHWRSGVGGIINPFRKQALELIKVVTDFEEVKQSLKTAHQHGVVSVATSAAQYTGSVSVSELTQKMEDKTAYVLAFGTAWGLAEAFVRGCDVILEPISGWNGYNHLSVRSAVSIILDRISMKRKRMTL